MLHWMSDLTFLFNLVGPKQFRRVKICNQIQFFCFLFHRFCDFTCKFLLNTYNSKICITQVVILFVGTKTRDRGTMWCIKLSTGSVFPKKKFSVFVFLMWISYFQDMLYFLFFQNYTISWEIWWLCFGFPAQVFPQNIYDKKFRLFMFLAENFFFSVCDFQ